MTSAKQGWADLSVKPKNTPKRAKGTWDVDDSKAEHIYGSFTRFDRPVSSWDEAEEQARWESLPYWSRDRQAKPEMVKRLKAAVVMVQTFTDALSGEQSNYTVSLDPYATTASTDLKNRIMKLPSQTILDPALSDGEAALLMVAFLGHEIGHVRIDDAIDKALQADPDVIEKGLYNSLSTILREARVEAGFSDLFPGYSGLFEPMLRWISRETKDGSLPPKDALGFAVAATRYPFRFDWSDPIHAAEAAWWVEWVERNSRIEDYPGHKAALDEAHAHIKAALKGQQDEPQDGKSGQSGSGLMDGIPGAGSNPGQSGEQDADGEGDAQGQSSKSSKTTTGKGGGKGASTGSPYEAVSADSMSQYDLIAAKNKIKNDSWAQTNAIRAEAREKQANGETPDYDDMYNKIAEIEKKAKAEQAALTRNKNETDKKSASIPASIEQVDAMREANAKKDRRGRVKRAASTEDARIATEKVNQDFGYSRDGRPVVASRETKPQDRGAGRVETDHEAVGIFRSTFMRLRGGNDARIGGKRSGRLDDRRIFRLADKRDDRVFTRRGAPKTQHLRVYLMVDTSGSMGGAPEQQIRAVSKALIEASFGADNLSLEVWGWDNTVAPVWQRGMDPDEVLRLNHRGGTDDAGALRFAVDRMRTNLRQDEHGLIIMMSDGAGSGNEMLRVQAERGREMGMSVFGIAMANLDQTEAYGENGWVKWQGSVAKTARPLAEIISQSWLTKDQHREGARS